MNGEQQEFLQKLDEKIRDYDKRIALQEQINKQQQEMSKKVFEKLDKLPCDIHTEKFNGINKSLGWLWGLLSGIIIVAIGVAVKLLAG